MSTNTNQTANQNPIRMYNRSENHVVVDANPRTGTGIDVTNWSHYGKPPEVEINWPAKGSVDIATAERFCLALQTAICVARAFEITNRNQKPETAANVSA